MPVDAVTVDIPRAPSCGATARGVLERELSGRVDAAALADAKLVTSELVVNAFQHGRGRIELRLRMDGDRLRLEVVDEGEGATIAICEEPAIEHGGYGLRVVDQLAVDWGAYEGTTHVWAELAVGRAKP